MHEDALASARGGLSRRGRGALEGFERSRPTALLVTLRFGERRLRQLGIEAAFALVLGVSVAEAILLTPDT
jgi:hypothetical protein